MHPTPRDVTCAQDAVDLKALLLPPGFDPLSTKGFEAVRDKFGLAYSRRSELREEPGEGG